MKAISFDFWGTLMISNPEFKKAQSKLVREFTNLSEAQWTKEKTQIKKELDELVEATGIHPPRMNTYTKLLSTFNLQEIKDFISYSNELFLKYPPLIREPETDIVSILREKDYRVYISSNTVLIYGDVLSKIIFDNFGIIRKNCNFSNEIGVSKPRKEMFEFPIKPTWHIGDNELTDGASENFGIKHYHINNEQNFKTFLQDGNI